MNYVKMSFLTVAIAFLVSCSSAGPDSNLELTVIRLAPTEANLFDDTSEEFSGQAVLDPKTKEIIKDPDALDGFAAALYRTGEGAKFELENITSGTYRVSVRARAHNFEGWPVMRVNVAGKQIGQDNAVERPDYGEGEQQLGEVYLEAGQTVEAVFTNDNFIDWDRDRNLFLDHLTLTPVTSDEPETPEAPENPGGEPHTPPPGAPEPSEPRNAVKPWSDPATWGGQVPEAGDTVEIKEDQSILLDVSPPALAGLRVQGDLIFAKQDLNLTSDWIVVEGVLQAGTAVAPYTHQATITLTGDNPNATTAFSAGIGVKAIGVLNEGSLELHGAPRTSWTQLSATAEQGATSIRLNKNDWRVGDRIVIASTDFDFEQAEERVITNVDGDSVSFEEPLAYMHYGELQTFGGKTLDQRAEVGLLNRNIVVQGDEASSNGLGGHIIARDNAQMSLLNIELNRMGQSGVEGRYPVHWHLMGDGARGSYLKNSVIHHSLNRCVTIHGSNGITLDRNVAYDAPGHCFFLEDGIEVDNVLKENLGLVTRRPSNENALLKSDTTAQGPATYWVTHPDNSFFGNVAAGSEGSGFWFALPENPTGLSAAGNENVSPVYAPLKVFKGNKAHSNPRDGLHIDSGPNGDAEGSVGVSRYVPRSDPQDEGSSVTAVFEDFTAYKNRNRGLWSRGYDHVFENFMLADNMVGSVMASDKSFVKNSVYVGESANKGTPTGFNAREGFIGLDGRSLPRPGRPEKDVYGFGFYDGQVGVEDTFFANFTPNEQRSAGAISVQHFTPFLLKPTNYATNLSFAENTQRVNLPPFKYDAESSEGSGDTYRTTVILDKDGSVSGQEGAHIVADNGVLLNDNCGLNDSLSGVRVCRGNDYGGLRIRFASERQSATLNAFKMEGSPRTPQGQFRANLLLNKPYTLGAESGFPAGEFDLLLEGSEGKMLELNMPISRAPTVRQRGDFMTAVASLAALRASTKTAYYYADGTLHVKLEESRIVEVSDF